MKSQQAWFDEYAESHQHKTNTIIHFICVPAIYFSIIGILMSVNSSFLTETIGLKNPLIANWASVLLIFILIFYAKLSKIAFFKMAVFSILCLIGNYYLGNQLPLFYASLIIFIIAWIGQFYGHHLEGKKPSFLKDLQFLLIGPIWVFEKLFPSK